MSALSALALSRPAPFVFRSNKLMSSPATKPRIKLATLTPVQLESARVVVWGVWETQKRAGQDPDTVATSLKVFEEALRQHPDPDAREYFSKTANLRNFLNPVAAKRASPVEPQALFVTPEGKIRKGGTKKHLPACYMRSPSYVEWNKNRGEQCFPLPLPFVVSCIG